MSDASSSIPDAANTIPPQQTTTPDIVLDTTYDKDVTVAQLRNRKITKKASRPEPLGEEIIPAAEPSSVSQDFQQILKGNTETSTPREYHQSLLDQLREIRRENAQLSKKNSAALEDLSKKVKHLSSAQKIADKERAIMLKQLLALNDKQSKELTARGWTWLAFNLVNPILHN